MKPESVPIRFYFPETSTASRDKRGFVASLMNSMNDDGGIKYAGYMDLKAFEDDISRSIGNGDFSIRQTVSSDDKQKITDIILETIQKCHVVLPHPDLPVFVFVYPWFPGAEDRILFGGSTALAAYYTMHIFVDMNSYTRTALEQTIAHEWNHLVFYRYHTEQEYSLRERMVLEGLAEVFREEVVGGQSAAWSVALSDSECVTQLRGLKKILDTTDRDTYKEVFLNGKTYKRWTGYSIGYRSVKLFKEKHSKLSWTDLIKLSPKEII